MIEYILLAVFIVSVTICANMLFMRRTRDRATKDSVRKVYLQEKEFRGTIIERTELTFTAAKDLLDEARTVSIRNKPVVLSIRTSPSGTVADVVVLESPLPQLTRSIVAKIAKWRFSEHKREGEPFPVSSKLTFYIVVEENNVVLTDPFRSLSPAIPRENLVRS